MRAPPPRSEIDAPFGPKTPEEHFAALRDALDLGFAIIPPERLAAVLAWQDPLPQASIEHLARLREEFRKKRAK